MHTCSDSFFPHTINYHDKSTKSMIYLWNIVFQTHTKKWIDELGFWFKLGAVYNCMKVIFIQQDSGL